MAVKNSKRNSSVAKAVPPLLVGDFLKALRCHASYYSQYASVPKKARRSFDVFVLAACKEVVREGEALAVAMEAAGQDATDVLLAVEYTRLGCHDPERLNALRPQLVIRLRRLAEGVDTPKAKAVDDNDARDKWLTKQFSEKQLPELEDELDRIAPQKGWTSIGQVGIRKAVQTYCARHGEKMPVAPKGRPRKSR